MSAHSRIASVLRNLFRRDQVERDLDAELQAYVEMAADERREAGLAADEARRAALIELGGFDQVKEQVRDVRAGALADELRQDVFYAIRMLRKNAGFTAVAVATLALGIGTNTAIFSVVDTVVFRSLPYRDPERLVKICGNGRALAQDDVTFPDFQDLREQSQAFEQVAADDGSGFTLTHVDGSRESIMGAMVTPDWLGTLGVQPILGRVFVPEDGAAGRDRVMLLTHAYWKRRFGGDLNVVGKTVTVDGGVVTIIGVLPPNVLRYAADFLTPVPADYPKDRKEGSLDVFARLKPGVTLAQAQAEIETIGRRLEQEYPATNTGRQFSLVPLGKYYANVRGAARRSLLIMLGAVGLVLLIACANVANLLLARALTRNRECVIRAALGAGRARLVRQMLVETVLLFLTGGIAGMLLARWSVDSLKASAVAGDYLPERMALAVDARVFAFGLATSLIAGVIFGLLPAFQASRVDLIAGLRPSGQNSSRGLGRSRASRLLIVSELALSLVLLVGFGLLIRSFLHVYANSAGINAQNLLEIDSDGGRSFSEGVTFWRAALDETRRMPGVEFAAVTSRPPVHASRRQQFAIQNRGVVPGEEPRAGDILISADYFRTLHIRLIKGRAFTEDDNGSAAPVVIISQSLAQRYFPNQDPIGQRLSLNERLPMTCCAAAGPVEGVWREIVGVVAGVRQANLDEEPAETLYRPYSQIVEHDMYLMVRARSSQDATHVAATLRGQLLAVQPGKMWSDVRHMENVIDGSESIRTRRSILVLLGSFAALALLLAAVGTYGVMAYSVAEQTREIGIRVALGATRPALLKQVLGETMKLALAGLAIGGLAAYTLTRFISTMLFGVSPTDALTYLGVSLLLVSVALLASYLPARRATRVDPMVAVRHE